jgi:hypothetical protein
MTVTTPPLKPTAFRETTAQGPRRIAVFGSLSAQRASRAGVEAPASAARAVLELIFAQIAEQAPLIARPILDRAVAEGTLTSVERNELLRELAEPDSTGDAPAAATGVRLGARAVLSEAFVAIRLAAPGIAQPILREAVADERLTPEQSRRILERLRSSPAAAFRATRSGALGS